MAAAPKTAGAQQAAKRPAEDGAAKSSAGEGKRARADGDSVPPQTPLAEVPPQVGSPPFWRRGGQVELSRVRWAPRCDSGRVLQALEHDGLAVLPGAVSLQAVRQLRQGGADFMGSDNLLRQTATGGAGGTKNIKVIVNIQGGPTERWETTYGWGGKKLLSDSVTAALRRHAPELEKRWEHPDWRDTSLVMTRKFTRPQRWHMDTANWSEKDRKYGLKGEWLLVFLVLYGSPEGTEGAAPDVCPFWSTKWIYRRPHERSGQMVWTRPKLAPGDIVIVRGSTLHRGGGGMDRAVGFCPFEPVKNYEDTGYPFGQPWLPELQGVNLKVTDFPSKPAPSASGERRPPAPSAGPQAP
eukprot:TRINITY_DN5245_c0_g1_i1.p3 TRINITY_DN5245_c0_g1~~TRINITY_DN5245_c0_g1_i1.p3  ORF type:complete len:377 (+),score=113.08 TRINITY_DN5245_c0_g1_i1:75-1133(+)